MFFKVVIWITGWESKAWLTCFCGVVSWECASTISHNPQYFAQTLVTVIIGASLQESWWNLKLWHTLWNAFSSTKAEESWIVTVIIQANHKIIFPDRCRHTRIKFFTNFDSDSVFVHLYHLNKEFVLTVSYRHIPKLEKH